MKKQFWILVFCLPLSLMGQNGELSFFLDVYRFWNPSNDSPYAEIFIALDGTSINYQKDKDDRFRPNVSGELRIKRLDGQFDSSLVFLRTLNFDLPDQNGLADTSLDARRTTLLIHTDLRFLPGRYLVEAELSDHYSPVPNYSFAYREFSVEMLPEEGMSFSDNKWLTDIETVAGRGRVAKTSPLITNDYFYNLDSIYFYQEIYNADRLLEGSYYVRSVIYQGDQRIWTTQTNEKLLHIRKGYPNLFYKMINLRNIRSNTYYLQVEVLDKSLRLIKTFRKKFYVYNSRVESDYEATVSSALETDMFNIYSEEQLDYYIKTLTYRSTEQEQNYAKVLENYEQKKNYLYSFFEKRKTRPDQKIMALWKGHLVALDYVNEHFKSTLREGWQTDRGRVFLQYNIPNDIERHMSESFSVPYEIWRYNRLGAQANVVFIFYDRDLATNEYPLLHSNKYGEINNPRWQSMLIGKGRVPSEVDYENSTLDDPSSRLDAVIRRN